MGQQKIVIASGNQGKIKEFKELLQRFKLELLEQAKFKIEDVDETASTFVENALLKAKNAAKISNLPAIADDSGLVIPAIGGRPGLYSARFAGVSQNKDVANINKVLSLMQDIPHTQRQAYYISLVVFIEHHKDPAPIICQGIWHGTIATRPIGDGGFGYDPIFYVPEYQQTAAQMDANVKNSMSHRYIAMHDLQQQLARKYKLA